MEIGPILQVLWRSRVGPMLLVMQIAVTAAVLINAFAIVQDRLERLSRPTGIDEANQFVVGLATFRRDDDIRRHIPLDLAAIRAMPGVVAATSINAMPAGDGGWSATLGLTPDIESAQHPSAIYAVDEHGLRALGVTLVEGRDFVAEEMSDYDFLEPFGPHVGIVTRALAERLFPGGNALAETVYYVESPVTIVGIVDRLVAPHVDHEMWERSIVFPAIPRGRTVQYLVRAEPGARDALMPRVEELLIERDEQRVITSLRTQESIMARAYEGHRGTSIVLISISGLLLAINALGVVGLASFLVTRRRRQIGTRRALGATRADICRYFMTEAGLIALGGVAAGLALTVAGNRLLAEMFELPGIDPTAMGVAAGVIMLLTQLAVLGPALRAASVPPALATRTV
jgi:putative ABC transport system permease protein